jgi:Uma2 family endonuclease
MAMPVIPEARRYSVAEVLDFPPDGNRYEVVAGELLVTPAPTVGHQLLVSRLMTLLSRYLEPLGHRDSLFTAPADITWGLGPKEAEDLVQPDLFVVGPGLVAASWLDVKQIVLAMEIVSPSSTRADRVVKRRTYHRHGVATYWVVDAAAQLVEVWHPADDRPEIVIDELSWKLGDQSPGLRIPLADLFAPPGSR